MVDKGRKKTKTVEVRPPESSSHKTEINRFPDLVDMRMVLTPVENQAGQENVDLELWIFKAPVKTNEVDFEVGVKQAYLQLRLDGADISPKSRFGEATSDNEVVTKVKEKKSTDKSLSVSAGAKADASALSALKSAANLSSKASMSHNVKKETEVSRSNVHRNVRAEGNDKWRISEADGKSLSQKYLDGECLCTIRQKTGANRRVVLSRVLIEQKDLSFKTEKIIDRMLHNRQRLLEIFLTKAMSENPANYHGFIEISKSEIINEG